MSITKTTLPLSDFLFLITLISFSSLTLSQGDDPGKLKPKSIIDPATSTNIKGTNFAGSQPITIISRQQLLASGITDIGDILQRLPSFSGSPENTRTNNGGTGAVRIDLRGIGSDRVLVLIDGHRTVDNGDFQSIPTVMVDYIEILKEGASTIYGSNAIAGVINIITRKSFTGTEVELSVADSFNTNNNDVKQASLVFGQLYDTADFIFGLQYEEQMASLQSDTPYDFLHDSFAIVDPVNFTGFDPNSATLTRIRSQNIPCGVFDLASGGPSLTVNGLNPGSGDCGTPGQLLNPADFREFNGDPFDPNNDTYNTVPFTYIQTPYEKANVFFKGTINFRGNEIFTSIRYNNRNSEQLIAPISYDSNYDPAYALADGGNGISADNVYNPFGEDIIHFSRRMSEFDSRITQYVQQYQAIIGARGNINNTDLLWEASYNFGDRKQITKLFGQLIASRVFESLGPSFFNSSGVAICGTPDNPLTGCVPLNLFGGLGTVTPEMRDFISQTTQTESKSQLNLFKTALSGTLFDLPAGPLSFAIGAEYKRNYTNSGTKIRGYTGGLPQHKYQKSKVKSLITEYNIPLSVSETHGKLDFNLALRYDDHTTIGSNMTIQSHIIYQPSENLVIRATYAEVFQEPSTDLLFSRPSNSFPFVSDPCNSINFSSLSPSQQAVCLAQNVPQGGVLQTDDGLRQLSGGNPNLDAESGNRKIIGLSWSPERLKGFTSSLDWWHIDLNDSFTNIGVENAILNCLNSGSATSRQCNLVSRRTDGSIIHTFGGTINSAKIITEGVDLAINYRFGTDYGRFHFNFKYSKMIDNHRQQFTGADIVKLEGRLTQNSAYNEDRAQFAAVWNYGDWGVNYGLDFLSHLTADLQLFDTSVATQRIPSQSYSDIAVTYALPWQKTKITVGINNIFNQAPPFIDSANIGTQPSTYRVFGRTWFMRWNTRF
ncbi:MAG: TonB-dependent receptor [Alcanivoracaceae bacterium]|nr:TonB-dependent receptor [Alcanivoracaceae bacterium]